MNSQATTLKSEFLKIKHSSIVWITLIAFALVPVMGGVFMLVLQHPQTMANAGLLQAKMEAMNVSVNWNALFIILKQGMGVGGIMVFGFIASWIFGREYSDGTAKDLLALPTSRISIVNSKFVVYSVWSLALALSNLLIGLLVGTVLQLPGFESCALLFHCYTYAITTILTILVGIPIAFFALWGKGYLAPLGFVVLTLVFSQIIAEVGYGQYFPWAIPAIYSGTGGEYKDLLNETSFLTVILLAVIGYGTTALYWKYADETK